MKKTELLEAMKNISQYFIDTDCSDESLSDDCKLIKSHILSLPDDYAPAPVREVKFMAKDYQEVIDLIRVIKSTEKYDEPTTLVLHIGISEFDKIEVVIKELVDKATPKQVVNLGHYSNGIEGDKWILANCPCCDNEIEKHNISNYCEECGQRLDWKGVIKNETTSI